MPLLYPTMALDSKILASALLASIATSGIWFALAPKAAREAPPTTPLAPAPSWRSDAELVDRLARLERTQAELEVRLARAVDQRREVLWEVESGLADLSLDLEASEVPAEGAEPSSALAPSPAARDFVLDVLAAERAREEEQRVEQAVERMRDLQLERALRIADRLELSAPERDALADLLVEEFDRGQELFRTLRTGTRDRDVRRSALEEWEQLRQWTNNELQVRFSPARADAIAEELGDPFRGLRGGWGGARGARGRAGGR